MDRAVHPAATEQRLIRRVDDGIDCERGFQPCDVPYDHRDTRDRLMELLVSGAGIRLGIELWQLHVQAVATGPSLDRPKLRKAGLREDHAVQAVYPAVLS